MSLNSSEFTLYMNILIPEQKAHLYLKNQKESQLCTLSTLSLFTAGGNPTLDKDPVQGGAAILLGISIVRKPG